MKFDFFIDKMKKILYMKDTNEIMIYIKSFLKKNQILQ